MIAAMYLRKSRAEENEPVSETLSRHRDILLAFAEKQKIVIAGAYEEVVSGDSLYGRPQMLKLLEDLSKYDAVLCMDIDRLGRGAMYEQGLIFDALRRAGVLIVTPGKTYDMADDMDDSLISFKALFAREEYKLIRGRLHRGVIKTVQEGGYVANAPFGYRKTRVDKKPTLVIDEHEAAAIRMMFDLYIQGKGCQIIADTMYSLGYRPHRGEKFNRTSIAKIIKNPVYIGKVVWNQVEHIRPKAQGGKHSKKQKPRSEWLIADGLHPPIVTQEQYDTANKIYDGRYHPPYRRAEDLKNPLSGVLFCASCGRAMVRMPLYKREYNKPIIICPTKGCCMSSGQDVVEQQFYTVLCLALNELETSVPVKTPSLPDYDTIMSSARSEIGKLQKQLDSLHDFLEQGVYDIDTFIRRREEIQQRILDAESVIENTRRPLEYTVILEKLKTVLDNYWNGTPIERNALIKEVVARVEYIKPKGSRWNTLPRLNFISWAKHL